MTQDNLKLLKKGDLITFRIAILQGGQPTQKTIRGEIKDIKGDVIFLDNNYFYDTDTEKRIMQPNIKVKNEIKPLMMVKKDKIIDYQKVNEEYDSNPTSKHEAIQLLKEVIHKILKETLLEDTTSTALYGGGYFNGEMPYYDQEMSTGQNKMFPGSVFPEDSPRIIAKKIL